MYFIDFPGIRTYFSSELKKKCFTRYSVRAYKKPNIIEIEQELREEIVLRLVSVKRQRPEIEISIQNVTCLHHTVFVTRYIIK